MSRKTLFLDFDGVLHPNLAPEGEHFTRAPALATVLSAAPVDVVLSTSWRFHYACEEILALLPQGLSARVVGATGAAIPGRWQRWEEIRAYCDRHRVRDWLALDDAAFEFPHVCPELLICDGAHGLGEPQLEALVRWLNV